MRNKFTEHELDSLLSRTPEFADHHFSAAVTQKNTRRITRRMIFLSALLGWVGFALLFGSGETLVRLTTELTTLASNLVIPDVMNISAALSVSYTPGIAVLCIGAGLLVLLTNKLRSL